MDSKMDCGGEMKSKYYLLRVDPELYKAVRERAKMNGVTVRSVIINSFCRFAGFPENYNGQSSMQEKLLDQIEMVFELNDQ